MDLGLTFSGIWLSTVPTHQCEDISYVVTSPAAGFGPKPHLTSGKCLFTYLTREKDKEMVCLTLNLYYVNSINL